MLENTITWYVPTISAQIVIQIIMALVFSYLYAHDRKPFLIMWGVGCYGWVLKLSFDLAIFQGHETLFFHIFNQLGCIIGAYFLSWGTINFTGKRMPKLFFIWVWLTAGWVALSVFPRPLLSRLWLQSYRW